MDYGNYNRHVSHYGAPATYYTPTASAPASYANPSYGQITPPPPGVDAYVPASTWQDPQYQPAAYSYSYADPSLAEPAAPAARQYYGQTPAKASRHRPGLGFKEFDLAEKKLKMILGGTKSDSVRVCSTCNVACNSDKVFETHIASAKHIAKVSGKTGMGRPMGPYPKKKKNKAQIPNGLPKVAQSVYCEICKISCTDLEMYNQHIAGKKHNKNIKNASMGIVTTTSNNNNTTNVNNNNTAKLIQFVPASGSDNNNNNNNNNNEGTNNININLAQNMTQKAQSIYCNICNISCNTLEVFNNHLAGKKHNRNVLNQNLPALITEANNNNNNNKRKIATKEEMEEKKRKLIENGTSVDSVKVCGLCNIVCTSQRVLDYHFKGQLHLNNLAQNEQDDQDISGVPLVINEVNV